MSTPLFNRNANATKPITYIVTVPRGGEAKDIQDWMHSCQTAYSAIESTAKQVRRTQDAELDNFQLVMGLGERIGTFGFTFTSTDSLAGLFDKVYILKKLQCCVAANPFAHEIQPMVTSQGLKTLKNKR